MEVLSYGQYKEYKKPSRYSIFPYYYNRIDNKYVYGITAHLEDPQVFVTHVVKENDTWDSLALYYYNNPTYYWVLMDANKCNDPFIEPKLGTKLKIPTFSNIQFDLQDR
jgi:nucleoid-associated protein YgaU